MQKQLILVTIAFVFAAQSWAAELEDLRVAPLPLVNTDMVRNLPAELPALSPQPAQMKTLVLISAEGAEITIKYETAVVQEDWAGKDIGAKHVSVAVGDGAFRGTEKVRIALKEWVKTHTGQIVDKTHKLDLEYAGSRTYRGNVPGHVMLYSDYSGDYYHNLVATVNGKRLHSAAGADSFRVEFVHGYRSEKIPQYPKDAFKGLQECSIVDAMFIRQPDLNESVGMLKPCMKAVSKRYGVSVSVEETKRPDSSGPGIGLFVSGKLMIGNPVLIDLNYSIKIRHGGLFGHKAYVEYLK